MNMECSIKFVVKVLKKQSIMFQLLHTMQNLNYCFVENSTEMYQEL